MAKRKFSNLFFQNEEDDVNDVLAEFKSLHGTTIDDNTETVDVTVDTSDVVDINTIYTDNNIDNFERSIFKIEQLKSVFPQNMTKEAKKESVLGVLNVTGLPIEEIINDAENRKLILSSVGNSFKEKTESILNESYSEIQQLETRIEELRGIISNREKCQEDQDRLIETEINKIDDIVNFIK